MIQPPTGADQHSPPGPRRAPAAPMRLAPAQARAEIARPGLNRLRRERRIRCINARLPDPPCWSGQMTPGRLVRAHPLMLQLNHK